MKDFFVPLLEPTMILIIKFKTQVILCSSNDGHTNFDLRAAACNLITIFRLKIRRLHGLLILLTFLGGALLTLTTEIGYSNLNSFNSFISFRSIPFQISNKESIIIISVSCLASYCLMEFFYSITILSESFQN